MDRGAQGQVMQLQGSWSDLSTRGFLVIKSFFSAQEIARLNELCQSSERTDTHYVSMRAPPAAVALVAEKIRGAIFAHLPAASGLVVDTMIPTGLLFPTQYTKLAWHTDHQSYYVIQSHESLVNFWLPLIKPLPNKSGLTLLPMDRLERAAPEIYQALRGRGAADLADGTLSYELDGAIVNLACPINPDELSESPDLLPGDLIIVRGDVPHRTQDAETRRLALSIRALSGSAPLLWKTMFTASPKKAKRQLSEPRVFRELLVAFWLHGRARISFAEFSAVRKKIAERQLLPRLLVAAASLALPVLVALHQRRGPAADGLTGATGPTGGNR